MRQLANNVAVAVSAATDTRRPVRLRIGSQHWAMDRDEAIALAAELVAAVDRLDFRAAVFTNSEPNADQSPNHRKEPPRA